MASWHVRWERVRFRDCDAMGHVNNAVYSTFLEEARIEVLGGLADFILARVEIDFRSELRAGEEIEVRTRCARVGTKKAGLDGVASASPVPCDTSEAREQSFELDHEIHADGRLAAQAKSVLVGYDYERGQSVPLSGEVRARPSG
jgi:acyl-CoA thioester hydrolase